MNEKETVKLFLDNGFQLSQEVLPIVNKNPEKYLSLAHNLTPRPFIISRKHLEKAEDIKKTKKIKVDLIKEFSSQKEKLKTEDYTRCFSETYTKIKEILLNNTQLKKLISVNKITPKTTDFSVIVSVRRKNMNNLVVEDTTGEANIFFDDDLKKEVDEIELDDIIGLKCEKKEGEFYIKKIIYPGIPMTREIKKTKKKINLIYLYKPSTLEEEKQEKLIDILRKTKKTDPIFIYGGWEDEEVIKEFDNIFVIEKEGNSSMFGAGGMNILTLPTKSNPEQILNKRLIKGKGVLGYFVLEYIPDIVLFSNEKTYHKNYHGTTIISNNDRSKYFVVNMKSREIEEKDI